MFQQTSSDLRSASPLAAIIHLAALLLLVVATAFQVDLAQPATDAFQEAEYATIGPLQRLHPDLRMPVLVHGGIDVYPSRLVTRLCPPTAQLVCVRAVNTSLQVAAGWLLVALFAMVAGLGSQAALLASAPIAAIVWFFGGPVALVADAHQGTPGIRDIAPLLALLLMARLAAKLDRRRPGPNSPHTGSLDLFFIGAIAAASPFWVYNRSLVTIGVALLFTLLLCAVRISLRPAILVALGALAALAAVSIPADPHLFADTIADIRYWAANTGLWQIPLQARTIAPSLTFCAVAFLLTLPALLNPGRPGRTLMIAALFATAILYTVQSAPRSDLLHMRWTLWPSALILAIGIRAQFDAVRTLTPRTAPRGAAFPAIAALLALICLETLSDRSIAYTTLTGLVRNVRLLQNPLASDRSLVSPEMRRIADLVQAAGRCTFAADNAGLVHLLSGTPPCSRFMFGAYIAPDHQDAVIAELEAANPEIILWSAPEWWANIDGRAFPERSPRLAAWIEQNFPVRTAIGRYTLLSHNDLVPTP